MTTIRLHPSELALAFSFAKATDIVGWGRDAFRPGTSSGGPKETWYSEGAARLVDAGRMLGTPEEGQTFSEDFSTDVLALVDPTVVLLAERKAGDGLRRMTVHSSHGVDLGMTRGTDGQFELTRYTNLTAGTAACVGFLGAVRSPAEAGTRIDTSREALTEVHALAASAQTARAVAKLVELGASHEDASSAVAAMAEPSASGLLSVLYCVDNVAVHAEPYSVLTSPHGETWIVFPPASLEGPMVLERSSVSALTARILVNVAVRLRGAAA